MENPLPDLIRPERILLHLQAREKWAAIHELIALLASHDKVSDPAKAEQAVREREHLLSTGLDHGIAIPHGKTETVAELVVAVGLSHAGIDFGSGDRQPARVIILALSPKDRHGPHIQMLAAISRVLHHHQVVEKLMAATSASDAAAILSYG